VVRTQRLPNSRVAVWIGGAVLAAMAAVGAASLASAGPQPDQNSAKQAEATRMEALIRAQHANAPKQAKPAQGSAELPPEPIAWDQGIFETQEAPIPSGIIRVTSLWTRTVGDRQVSVYAGASVSDPAQGLLVVMKTDLYGRGMTLDQYKAPQGLGALRVVAERGTRVSLRSEQGSTVEFDAVQRRFL
jgi:hypothetical protein